MDYVIPEDKLEKLLDTEVDQGFKDRFMVHLYRQLEDSRCYYQASVVNEHPIFTAQLNAIKKLVGKEYRDYEQRVYDIKAIIEYSPFRDAYPYTEKFIKSNDWGYEKRPEGTHMLDHMFQGRFLYSKDINSANRVIYSVDDDLSITLLSCISHEDKKETKSIKKSESRTFSEERLTEREKWVQDHSKMSKTSQRLLMPLHLRYPDVQPFDESFKQALEKAEQQKLKTARKEPIPEPEPLTVKLLYENDIKGTLFERRHDKPWKVITR